MNLEIAGKTALITGASTGIGRGIALALAAEGVHLAIAARRRNLLDEVAAEIVAAGGARPVVIECDMLQPEAAAEIAGAVLAGLGSVDILINNAGGSRRFDLDTTEAQWEEALTLNFTRQRQLTHRLLRQMMARNWGRIINITGKSEPEGINGAFCAKAAMHSWAKGLSREVGKHGITVNSIPPGRIMMRADPAQLHAGIPPVAGGKRNSGGLIRRARRYRAAGVLSRLAAGALYHRHRDPGGRRAAPLSVLRPRLGFLSCAIGCVQEPALPCRAHARRASGAGRMIDSCQTAGSQVRIIELRSWCVAITRINCNANCSGLL